MSDAFQVRTLQPADVTSLVAVHRRAFPGFFLSTLGPGFLGEFYRGFLDDPSAVTAVVVDEAGRCRGGVVGTTTPEGYFGRLVRRRWHRFAMGSFVAALRDPRVAPRLARALWYRGDVPATGGGALLSSICMDPELQGYGLGQRLIEAWKGQVTRAGVGSAFLTTDTADNDDTHRFYQRNGWHVDGEFTTPEGRRMTRYRWTATTPGDVGDTR